MIMNRQESVIFIKRSSLLLKKGIATQEQKLNTLAYC
jgi:hypothetical protein